MRKLFWILLLANVILFALMQRGALDWLGWDGPGVQPQPELNVDKIRLLPAPQSPPAKPLSAAPARLPQPLLIPLHLFLHLVHQFRLWCRLRQLQKRRHPRLRRTWLLRRAINRAR